LIDLRDALRNAKREERVYHRTDTHWNDAGATVAYREILARLRREFPDMDAGPIPGRLEAHEAAGGDLARILALEDRFRENMVERVPASPRRAHVVADDADAGIVALECEGCGQRTLLMNHDSFNANLAPLLAEHFARTVLVEGTRLNRAVVERERPAIVIQEFVERALMCPSLHGC